MFSHGQDTVNADAMTQMVPVILTFVSLTTVALSATIQKLPDPETLVFGEVCPTFLVIRATQRWLQVIWS